MTVAAVLALTLAACADAVVSAPSATFEIGTHRPSVDASEVNALVTSPVTTRPDRGWGVAAPADRLRRIDVAVSGDILIHQAVWESAAAHSGGEGYDFTPMFKPIQEVQEAVDLALCHLEVPLSADNTDLSSYPRFNAPYQLADGLAAAGFDGCSLASNHVLDQGVAGIESTLGHLDRVGLGSAGAARNPEEAVAITTYEIRGTKVAHLSYTYGYNGLRPPPGEEWRSNLNSADAIAVEAKRARDAGADLVLLSVHWGDEYVSEPSAYQRQLAAALDSQADIDLIIGHHAHVIQPVTLVGETPVIYGLGNLVSNMGQLERREGVVIVATFEASPGAEFALAGLAALPTLVERPGHIVVPAPVESWERTMARLGSEGVAVTPWPDRGWHGSGASLE